MLLVAGLPGSGKSAFARAAGGRVLELDSVMDMLGTPEDLADDAGLAWRAFLARIEHDRPDVAVAVFSTRRERLEARLATGRPCSLAVLHAPQSVRLRRIAGRIPRPCHGRAPKADTLLEAWMEPVADGEGFQDVRLINCSDEGDAMDSNIYLKVVKGEVLAYASEADVRDAEKVFNTGHAYDAVVSTATWAACRYCARLEDGKIVLGEPEEVALKRAEATIRSERALRLRACDKISPMRWNAMSEAQRADWTAYRQALLDIPQQPGFPWGGDPGKAPWPIKPE